MSLPETEIAYLTIKCLIKKYKIWLIFIFAKYKIKIVLNFSNI